MEIGILLWALSACACAFWMSARAMNEGMVEFRWYIAGLVGNVFAVPFFLLAVRRASLDQAALRLEEDLETFADSAALPLDHERMQDTVSPALTKRAA